MPVLIHITPLIVFVWSHIALKATFVTTTWDETVVSGEDTPTQIKRVRTERKFSGAMEGLGIMEYVMCYPYSKCPAGQLAGKPTFTWQGICHFRGTIDGSPPGEVILLTTNGSFVETAEAQWTIDEKTGSGGLKGLKGRGGYNHAVDVCLTGATDMWLEYTL
ncbi:hypothetical protein RhiJN_12614 [Ceratobasidium sp. AG-Ba]|nr:hypothetical protein RhiJN_12614 [Ceratobasidium sp. AG-Ba]